MKRIRFDLPVPGIRVLLAWAGIALYMGLLAIPAIISERRHQRELRQPQGANPSTDTSTRDQGDPNRGLEIVGVVTLVVIAWQAWETRRSVESNERQFRTLHQQ